MGVCACVCVLCVHACMCVHSCACEYIHVYRCPQPTMCASCHIRSIITTLTSHFTNKSAFFRFHCQWTSNTATEADHMYPVWESSQEIALAHRHCEYSELIAQLCHYRHTFWPIPRRKWYCVCVCVCVRACMHVCNCVLIRPANHLTGQNTSHAGFLQLNISSCSSWTYPSMVPRLYMRTARKARLVHFLISLSTIKRILVRNNFWIIPYHEW